MIPGSFEYYAPTTLDEAIQLLGQHSEDGKVLAGGHSLIPMMKLRFAQPTHLIDINRIEELRKISSHGDTLHIGAMVSENSLIASDLLWTHCPLIPEAARLIADPQVRNRGTIGGDVAHGDPGNDHPAIMLALGASFVVRGTQGERVLPADGFYLGTFATQMEADEILTEIRVPIPPKGSGHSYQKLKRKVGDFATAGAAVQLTLKRDKCEHIGIALTNVGPTALKVKTAEELLLGKEIDGALITQAAQLAMDICEPAEDLRGSVEYKTHMAGEMTRRALDEALSRAKGA